MTPALSQASSELHRKSTVRVGLLTLNLGGYDFTKHVPASQSKLNAREFWDYSRLRENDLLVLGFQEIVEAKKKNVAKFMFGAEKDHSSLVSFLNTRLPEFDLFHQIFSASLGLLIFVRNSTKEHLDLHVLKTHSMKMGLLGLIANKGVIGCELQLNGTRHVFFNAHFAAGEVEKNLDARVANFAALHDLIGMRNGSGAKAGARKSFFDGRPQLPQRKRVLSNGAKGN